MRDAFGWTVLGLLLAFVGFQFSGATGVYAIGAGLVATGLGTGSLFGLYTEEFRMAVIDLKQRTLGQSRSKYER
ncbi:hypothetical protein [Halorubellus salinus]|uniref:hypothetical protein n=1 Tax=Halorubellus salinus TaxID=755309 RepID=UPI001D081DD4|nr:hypothetical protein [Halorubellus salinus]